MLAISDPSPRRAEATASTAFSTPPSAGFSAFTSADGTILGGLVQGKQMPQPRMLPTYLNVMVVPSLLRSLTPSLLIVKSLNPSPTDTTVSTETPINTPIVSIGEPKRRQNCMVERRDVREVAEQKKSNCEGCEDPKETLRKSRDGRVKLMHLHFTHLLLPERNTNACNHQNFRCPKSNAPARWTFDSKRPKL